jgi:hypothetical protein
MALTRIASRDSHEIPSEPRFAEILSIGRNYAIEPNPNQTRQIES